MKRSSVEVFVEGGGDTRSATLATECRHAFSHLFEGGPKPRITACGGRAQTYDAFATEVRKGRTCFLLIDAEDVPRKADAWEHLATRDGWDRLEAEAHLMVVTMEVRILSDPDNLKRFSGSEYGADKVPKWPNLEAVAKDLVNQALRDATKGTKKGAYEKGRDSFKLLAGVDVTKLEAACPRAKAFLAAVRAALA